MRTTCLTVGSWTKLRGFLIVVGLLAFSGFTTIGWAESPLAEASSEGLKGLLTAEPPSHLLEILGRLPESWRAWTDSVSKELNAFHNETPSDIAAQRAAIAKFKARIKTIDRALRDTRYKSIWNDLVEIRGRLIKPLEVSEAALDTLSTHDAATYASTTKQNLRASFQNLDAYLGQVSGGEGWKTYLHTAEVGQTLASEKEVEAGLNVLKRSLKNLQHARGSSDTAVREFCERPVLKQYLIDLDRAVAASQHLISGIQWGDIRGELKTLLGALQEYDENKLLSTAQRARTSYDRLRQLAPNGGDRITNVLRRHYLNSNFQASISEGFLNRLMATSRVESGGVRDFILGADVYGSQTTSSVSTVNLLPSGPGARLQIQLNGDVANNTEAYASKAVIYSNGNHHFDGYKDVLFDGITFSTTPAMLNVVASNQPVAASTRADGIPILAGIARRIALRTANRNRPETEAIAVQRVDSRVLPRFNDEVDSAFARLNAELHDKITVPLQSEQLYPDYISARSTDSELTLNTRLMPQAKLGGGVAPLTAVGPDDVVFSFHESLLNNTLDLLPISGRTMTESEFKEVVNQRLRVFFPNRELVDPSSSPNATEAGEPKRIIFAETDPLRVEFEDGNVLLAIRAGFERDEDRGGNIPPQLITIPLRMTLVGNEIVMTRGDISTEPLASNDNLAQQVLVGGVTKSRLEKSIPEISKSASSFDLARGDKSLHMQVREITIKNGWLSVRSTSDRP